MTGLLAVVGQFPLPLQLSVYFGLGLLTIAALRPIVRRLTPPKPELDVTALVERMVVIATSRVAQAVWIEVRNRADAPQADALNVGARITVHDKNGLVALGTFPARWRDSPLPVGDRNPGNISDRQPIQAGSHFRQLDALFRYDGEKLTYALNTDAMQYPHWQKPGWSLAPGTYRLHVRVNGTNVPSQDKWFALSIPEAGDIKAAAD